MRINEILLEMPAIAAKHAGSKPVVNPNGALGKELYNVIEPGKFTADVFAFPDPAKVPAGQYPTKTQMDQAVAQAAQKFGKIHWVNAAQKNSAPDKFLGFALSKWRNENNQPVTIGKYLYDTKAVQKSHPNTTPNYNNPRKFDANDLAAELGYYSSHGNNRTAVAPSSVSGKETQQTITLLEPKDILSIDQEYTVNDIISAVSNKFGADSPLTALTKSVAAGNKSNQIDTTGISINHLNKSFTELLHPIALMSGAFNGEAPAVNLAGATIRFTQSSGALSDSIMTTTNGTELFVSSKFKSGTAPALGKDFAQLLTNLPPAIKKKYPTEIDILNTIATNPQQPKVGSIGPLAAAVKLNILSNEEAKFIASLSADKTQQSTQLPKNTPKKLKDIVNNAPTAARGKMSYYILMKYAMDAVAQTMNSTPASKVIMNAILGNNFVTVSTSASLNGTIDTMTFTTKLLSQTDPRDIKLTTGTAYHLDHIKNRLQFTIL